MQNKIIEEIEKNQINHSLPVFNTGDTVKVTWVISNENEKERLQLFQGLVINIKGSGVNKNITVRKGVKDNGVEKIFPLHSPLMKKIEVVATGQIRQAKPYFLRQLRSKPLKKKVKSKINMKIN